MATNHQNDPDRGSSRRMHFRLYLLHHLKIAALIATVISGITAAVWLVQQVL